MNKLIAKIRHGLQYASQFYGSCSSYANGGYIKHHNVVVNDTDDPTRAYSQEELRELFRRAERNETPD